MSNVQNMELVHAFAYLPSFYISQEPRFFLQVQITNDNSVMVLLNDTSKAATLYWNTSLYHLEKDFKVQSPIRNGQFILFPPKGLDDFVHIAYKGGLLDVSLYMLFIEGPRNPQLRVRYL